MPCFWGRGITPRTWTHLDPPDEGSRHNINNTDPCLDFDPNKDVYLDGSGGIHTRDPRIRRAGWAWSQVQGETQDLATQEEYDAIVHLSIGKHGTSPGPQSVPRSEMWALIEFLMFACTYEPCDVNIYTDSKIVFNGTQNRKIANAANDDLWQNI